MSTDDYGFSTHYSFSPGMSSDYIDHLLVHPHTGWQGTRGVRVSFGADDIDEEDDDSWLFDEFGSDDDSDYDSDDDDLAALEAEIDEDLESFGRLYLGEEDWRLAPASSGDLGALIGRSGSSGYRGGRPTFGADAKVRLPGILEYEGSNAGALALGLAAMIVFFQNPPWAS